MPDVYVPLDVNYQDDDKVIAAGAQAELLYVRSLALVKRLRSDGRVNHRHLHRLTDGMTVAETMDPRDPTADELADRLVVAGLWRRDESGWVIAAWDRHNMTRDQIDASRESGIEGNHKRWHVDKGIVKQGCRLCHPPKPASESGGDRGASRGGDTTPDRKGKGEGREREENNLSPMATVRLVFEAWQESTGHARAVLDAKRQRVIRSALNAFPEQEVVDAVRGWKFSPFHRGENDRHTVYNDLALVLRDAAHVEMFRDFARQGDPRAQADAAAYELATGRVGRE